MTGYQSKKKAAQDKLDSMEREALKLALKVLEDLPGFRADIDNAITAIKEALAQQKQEPASITYKEVADAMNKLRKGTFEQRQIADEMENKRLYTSPPQRPWVEPTGNEWFEWWRVSKVADETEAEIDFADFLIIAQAVVAKLKEKNNG